MKIPEGSTWGDRTNVRRPSALMMRRSDDSIGKRAQEFIEDKLRKATGTAADIQQLEQLIARMGSGFYRSEGILLTKV